MREKRKEKKEAIHCNHQSSLHNTIYITCFLWLPFFHYLGLFCAFSVSHLKVILFFFSHSCHCNSLLLLVRSFIYLLI